MCEEPRFDIYKDVSTQPVEYQQSFLRVIVNTSLH